MAKSNTGRYSRERDFEKTIREYLRQGKDKLIHDLAGTREAIKLISSDKVKEFMTIMDTGLDKNERECLSNIIVSAMYQSFCYGYGIGRIEGDGCERVYL